MNKRREQKQSKFWQVLASFGKLGKFGQIWAKRMGEGAKLVWKVGLVIRLSCNSGQLSYHLNGSLHIPLLKLQDYHCLV